MTSSNESLRPASSKALGVGDQANLRLWWRLCLRSFTEFMFFFFFRSRFLVFFFVFGVFGASEVLVEKKWWKACWTPFLSKSLEFSVLRKKTQQESFYLPVFVGWVRWSTRDEESRMEAQILQLEAGRKKSRDEPRSYSKGRNIVRDQRNCLRRWQPGNVRWSVTFDTPFRIPLEDQWLESIFRKFRPFFLRGGGRQNVPGDMLVSLDCTFWMEDMVFCPSNHTLPETTSSHLKMDVSQKETIVFQPSIFRGELLVSHGEAQAVGDEEAMKRYGARLVFRGTRGKKLRAGKWWFKLDPQKISNTFFFGGEGGGLMGKSPNQCTWYLSLFIIY